MLAWVAVAAWVALGTGAAGGSPRRYRLHWGWPFEDEGPARACCYASTPLRRGQVAFMTSCMPCHSLGPERLIGPGFRAMYGRRLPAGDGTFFTVDAAYVRRSLADPASRPLGARCQLGEMPEDSIRAELAEYLERTLAWQDRREDPRMR